MQKSSTHQDRPIAIFITRLNKKIRKSALKLEKKQDIYENCILVFVFRGTLSMQQTSFFLPACKKNTTTSVPTAGIF